MTPSLTARIVSAILRTTRIVSRRFAGGPGMHKVIAASRRVKVPVPTKAMHRRLAVRSEAVGGRDIWHLAPRDRAPTGHLLFFHGGGYVFTAAPPHWQLYARLAEQHGVAVTAPLYPLAPEASATEVTDFALDTYRRFIETHDGPFVVGGDSAGAGLAAATIMAARDAGLRLPDGLLLICPWLDATASHPDQRVIESRDAILRLRGVRDAGLLYARDLPIDDWRVSPIRGDWSGLPPILAFGGGDDILVTDARALKAKVPSIDYVELASMIHDWPILFFPESRAAQQRMGAFITAAR